MKPPSTARTAGRSDWAERRFRRQPFILLSFSSSKKARKAQETQSYQRIQCIGHTDFKGLSNAVTNTHPLLPSMGTTRQKNSCRNRLQNGPHSLLRMKVGTHTRLCQQDRTQRLTRRNRGCFGWGRYYYPRSVLRGSETLRGQVSERRTLPLLDLGREVLSKNAESLRDSDALMRVAVPKASRPRWAA